MKTRTRRGLTWLLALVLTAALAPASGRAVLADVYITAVNERLLELNSETMPFWSEGLLYVSNKVFEGTDLGVTYVRNNSMNLAVLYTPRSDLRFDLSQDIAYDKQGIRYAAHAIEKGNFVFFPLDTVCRYFGLKWSQNETDTVPLIRVTSDSAALEDSGFIDAASGDMRNRYNNYEKWVREQQAAVRPDPPPIQAVVGQKIYLIVESTAAADTRAVMDRLGETKASFLVTVEQMADSDLLRELVARGHTPVLRLTGESEGEMETEIETARQLLWQSACAWLELVWYQGAADIAPLLSDLGCQQVVAGLDESGQGLSGVGRARVVLGAIGRHREDLGVYLGLDSNCADGLEVLLRELEDARYSVCAWRLVP